MKTTAGGIQPPETLSESAKAMWSELVSEYGISDAAGLNILKTGLECWDLAEKARIQIDKDGLTVLDKFSQMKNHPLLPTLRDARSGFLNAMKMMRFDVSVQPPKPKGR